jgi:hypothetical protein
MPDRIPGSIISAHRREERELCARQVEALAIAIRDNGPKSAEGLLTAVAGAQVGVLFDAADSLRKYDGETDAPLVR